MGEYQQAFLKHEPEKPRAMIAKFTDLPPQVEAFMLETVTKRIARFESDNTPFKILDEMVDGD